jgi:sigma-E factor negative regulatory protein RseB
VSHLHDRISGLVDGELAGGARTRALHHLSRCEECRAEVRATLAVKRRLEGLVEAEPPGDLRAVLGSLPSPALTVGAGGRRAHSRSRAMAGAATMSVALLGVAYAVGAPQEQATTTVTPPVEQFAAEFAAGPDASPMADPAIGALDWQEDGLRLLAVGPAALPAVAGIPAPRVRGDDSEAVRLLERAFDARSRLGYSGEQRLAVFDGPGPALVNVQVEHVPGQGTSVDVLGAGAGSTFVQASDPAGRDGGRTGELVTLLDGHDVVVSGSEQVAGRAATVVSAVRAGQVTARFWIDDASGLLLRRDLYADGRLARTSRFTSIDLSDRDFLAHLPPEMGVPASTRLSMTFAPTLTDKGWACPEELPGGFRLSGLEQLSGDVVHAAYSDGISRVAVYEQRGSLDPSQLAGFTRGQLAGQPLYRRDGIPAVAIWESGGTVFTLVSDAPAAATYDVVAALPHEEPAEPGTLERVGEGLRRLGSMLDPVD